VTVSAYPFFAIAGNSLLAPKSITYCTILNVKKGVVS
jgi:hypothetical protein